MATLADLRIEARSAAGVDAGDPLHSDAFMNRDVNATLAKIATLGEPWWLHEERTVNLVADQHEYPLASDVTLVRWVLVEEAEVTYPLELRRRQDTAKYRDEPAGNPAVYSADGAVVRVGPKPASTTLPAALRLGVTIAEPRLVVDTAVPKLPDYLTDAIVTGAAYRAAIRDKNVELAAMLRGERDEWFGLVRSNMRRALAAPRVRLHREWT